LKVVILELRKEKKNRQVLRLPAELPAVMEGYRGAGRFLGKRG
jgi:hypothetical protein